MTVTDRKHQRSVAVLVRGIRISTPGNQEFDDGNMTMACSPEQWGGADTVPGTHVGTHGNQGFDDGDIVMHGSIVQRGDIAIVDSIHVGSLGRQEFDDGGMAVSADSPVQQGDTKLVCDIYISALAN